MRPTTTTALALAGTALALPAAATAELGPPTPTETTLAAPLAGHVSVGDQMEAARSLTLQQRLMPRAISAAGKVARVKGVGFSRAAQRRELRGASPGELRAEIRGSRRELRRAKRERRANTTAAPHLEAIAACESGGNPSAVDASGTYRGKYQFDYGTWSSVGGSGDPAAAPEAEQDKRAAALYARVGSTPWPVCGG
jgi:Transglycosylase-like domain